MKRTLLLLLALASTVSARTLLDTRTSYPQPYFESEEQQKVLGNLKRWPGFKVCKGASVQDTTTGSFTRKGAKETLYIMQNGCFDDPDSPDRVNSKYWHLALYSGGKLQQVWPRAGQLLGNVGDLNGDGLDDLLFLAFREGDEEYTEYVGATFFTLSGGKFRRLLDLDEVHFSECNGAAGSQGIIRAYRVSLDKPAPQPVFTIEQFRNKSDLCNADLPLAYTFVKKWTQRGNK